MNPVSNNLVETCLRNILKEEGFKLNPKRGNGERGVDIIASKGGVSHYIEVIGAKKQGPARSKDFYEGFFRTVSRLNDGAKNCALALPDSFGKGMNRRVKQHFEAWKRIGAAFPELEIWLVDIINRTYQRYAWAELAKGV